MSENQIDKTITFSISQIKEMETKQALTQVYNALKEKGYNPINQIVGYILSEDPTYITNYNNARAIVAKLDRDELLKILVASYLAD
ncbi:MAG: IreB family regulatory phosphoprotein [Clostridiales bacterium]|nr:IreB family regulatory phosphoprotein [Clostridia bacterium]MCR5352904.1 IreB family regulatory phosphoprotein [Clostridiales bacterium]